MHPATQWRLQDAGKEAKQLLFGIGPGQYLVLQLCEHAPVCAVAHRVVPGAAGGSTSLTGQPLDWLQLLLLTKIVRQAEGLADLLCALALDQPSNGAGGCRAGGQAAAGSSS